MASIKCNLFMTRRTLFKIEILFYFIYLVSNYVVFAFVLVSVFVFVFVTVFDWYQPIL